VIGFAGAHAASNDLIGPWWLLTYDHTRTPILSFVAPVSVNRQIVDRSTNVHVEYFRGHSAHRPSSPLNHFHCDLMDVLASASTATPVDNEFWSVVFPPTQGRPKHGALRFTYVTAQDSVFLPQLALLVVPDDTPAQLVFSARRAFAPVSLPEWDREIVPTSELPLAHEAETTRTSAAIPLPAILPPLALPPVKHDLTRIAAYQRLREALPLTDDELADVLGVGRTTPYKWTREGSSPRVQTLRFIVRLDAIVRGLLASRARAEFDEWLVVGDPAPVQLLRDHAIDEFERRANAAIFTQSPGRAVGYEVEAPPLPRRTVTVPGIAPRRAKVSLAKRDR
jgi:excisionase family DNA binding protein